MKYLFLSDGKDVPVQVWVLNIGLVAIGIAWGVWTCFSALGYDLLWENVWNYRSNMIQGFFTTIAITLVSLIFSLVLGLFVGLARKSGIIMLRILCRVYIEVVRGTPLLVQVLVFFYVVAHAAGIDNRFFVGVCIMSTFSGAYIAEIVRSGIESIPGSQLEAARSLGLTQVQTYRYIVFPQVITRILPPLTGQAASLIKDSSLLSIISIREFTMAAREVNANTFSTLESYIPLAIGYLLITLPISFITARMEKRYKHAS
ncbi:MAG: amino acid ABC transporter permease [Desulfobacteraceae bacterium]|nr:amino acid ABC transporter permease [Desulfobacteraceae bacterium]